MLNQNLKSIVNKQAHIFPKLFIGSAAKAFVQFLNKNNYQYEINYISTRDELISFIEQYSNYKNYSLPVIISDISFFNKKDQSVLLKFMDDTKLNLILLASRDNILDTIISRVKEFRKFYIQSKENQAGFISISKAREMLDTDIKNNHIEEYDSSFEDKIILRSKYNPMLSYDENLVRKFGRNDRKKLLGLLEYE